MKVYTGIDESEQKHDVVFMNEAGVSLAQLTIDHRLEGMAQFEAARHELGLQPGECVIGLESAHHLVIDYLWSHGYQEVYVIPPSQTKSNRGRYRSSGARTDPHDALVLADVLRTDRGRLQPWHPDSLLTRQLRAQVSWVGFLTRSCTRLVNRLRAVLLRYYPGAVAVFSSLTTRIAPQFVIAYPTPQAAAQLSFEQFEQFARAHGYPHPKQLGKCYKRLRADYVPALPETVAIYQQEAVQLAQLLSSTQQARQQGMQVLAELFAQHPDAPIFASLPGTGDLLAPALLAKFGDDRARFASPASVQALAGTCPVTDQSGGRRTVRFRRACDREWRYFCEQWAIALLRRRGSPIALAYWEQIRPHCASVHHARRCLSNRWLAIAWKLWQTHQLYEASRHFQQRAQRSQPRK